MNKVFPAATNCARRRLLVFAEEASKFRRASSQGETYRDDQVVYNENSAEFIRNMLF
jgi:hypothetical protein